MSVRQIRKRRLSEDELHALPTMVNIQTAADALDISRTTAYKLARLGEFPVPIHRYVSSFRVPKAPLLRYLGIETDEFDHTDDTPRPTSNGQADVSHPVSRVLDFRDAGDVPVPMRNRRGRVKLIYPDEMYRVDGQKVSGADIIGRGYIHADA